MPCRSVAAAPDLICCSWLQGLAFTAGHLSDSCPQSIAIVVTPPPADFHTPSAYRNRTVTGGGISQLPYLSCYLWAAVPYMVQEIVTEDTAVKSNHFKASEDNPKVRVRSEKSGKEVRQ